MTVLIPLGGRETPGVLGQSRHGMSGAVARRPSSATLMKDYLYVEHNGKSTEILDADGAAPVDRTQGRAVKV